VVTVRTGTIRVGITFFFPPTQYFFAFSDFLYAVLADWFL